MADGLNEDGAPPSGQGVPPSGGVGWTAPDDHPVGGPGARPWQTDAGSTLPWDFPPGHPQPAARSERLAITALIFALLSLIIPVIPAVVALVVAARAAARIRRAGGELGGAGLVTAARVIAVLGLVLVPLGFAAVWTMAPRVSRSHTVVAGVGPIATTTSIPATTHEQSTRTTSSSMELPVEDLNVGSASTTRAAARRPSTPSMWSPVGVRMTVRSLLSSPCPPGLGRVIGP